MAQCKMCGRKGLLLSVSADGLCRSCAPIVVMDVQQRGRIIKDSMKLIEESKNTKTRVSRCDLLIQHAQALSEYERKGIPLNPSPSQLLSQYTAIRAQLAGEEKKDVETASNACCPHCNVNLDPVPKRKTKCPSCRKDIYVRTDPGNGKVHVTMEDAFSLDIVKRSQIEKKYQEAKKRASKNQSIRTTVWGLLNSGEQARLLFMLGENYFPLLQESMKESLRGAMQSGIITHVKILSSRDDRTCEKCKSQHGMVFTIKEALEKMPLPVKCDNGEMCRCVYTYHRIK